MRGPVALLACLVPLLGCGSSEESVRQATARVEVARAPHTVAATASYTDRLPDALLVTGTDVEGLTVIDLP